MLPSLPKHTVTFFSSEHMLETWSMVRRSPQFQPAKAARDYAEEVSQPPNSRVRMQNGVLFQASHVVIKARGETRRAIKGR